MTANSWSLIGASADIVLASGAIYVTWLHLRAHRHDKLQEQAGSATEMEKHALHAKTLRQYASLSDRSKLVIILIATIAKLAASIAKFA